MNLCIDVGNTTIGVGFFKEEQLYKRLSYTVDTKKTSDEYISVIERTLKDLSLDAKQIDRIIFSSVVPSVNDELISAVKAIFNKEPLLIAPGVKTGLPVHVDNPSEVGNDLIAVMVGAKEKYGYPCLITDLGTATKVLLIDKSGAFVSCVIMPGMALSVSALTNRAALLHEISIKAPKSVMAKNTVDAINAGVTYGHADMIDGIIARYENELGYKCKHILTGGSAIYLKDILKNEFVYDEILCLEGLNRILIRNEDK